ncbi:MAG TPA: MnhB domain-containing protein [Pantanalinema sp.]
MNNPLVRFVAALVFGVTWVIAWQEILYASELPGEGFTASILLLLVVLLQYAVMGRAEAARRLPPPVFARAMTAGCLLLLVLVAVPLAWGGSALEVFKIPLGPYALSSTTLFDLALFLTVSGSMLAAFCGVTENEV